MKPEDFLTLAKAGFNATQITAIMTLQNAPAPAAPAPAAPAAPAPAAAAPAPAPAPAAAPAPAPATPALDPLTMQIQNLTAMIQQNALNNTNMPTPPKTDDILASIINPPTPAKEVK